MNLNLLTAALREGAEANARKAAASGKDALRRVQNLYRKAEGLTAPASEMKKAPVVDRLAERLGFWAIPGYGLYSLGKSHGAGGPSPGPAAYPPQYPY